MSAVSDRPAAAPSLWIDVAAVGGVTLAVAALAVTFDLHEMLFGYTRRWEWLQVDELPLVLLALSASLMVVAVRRYRQAARELHARRAAEQRLSAALASNRELAQEQLRAVEAERQRLARELHDELGQYVNAIKLDAVALRGRQLHQDEVATTAQQIVAGLGHMHEAVGAMIRRLRPVALDDLGLGAALEVCVGTWQARLPQLHFVLHVGEGFDDLGETLNLTLYRLVQEGLTNAVKHSGARQVEVTLRRLPSAEAGARIQLCIADDGQGAASGALQRGFGLRGMRERVELLGGSWAVRTAPGAGFVIEAGLPEALQ